MESSVPPCLYCASMNRSIFNTIAKVIKNPDIYR